MAKINISFDGTDYSIDEANLESATAELKTHLSSVMNGSGATINFDGTAYSVDSTKLSNATNNLISYFQTITGSGFEIVINGTTYSIDSSKINDSINALHTAFDKLQSSSSEETEDELAGTWVFNSTIGLPTISEFNFIFISYSQTMTSLRFKTSISDRDYMYYVYGEGEDDEALACSGAFGALSIWNDTEYQTITITSKLSEVTNGDALLTWLKANATKQEEEIKTDATVTITNTSTSYVANVGTTYSLTASTDIGTVGKNATETFTIPKGTTIYVSSSTGVIPGWSLSSITGDIVEVFSTMGIYTINGDGTITGYALDMD